MVSSRAHVSSALLSSRAPRADAASHSHRPRAKCARSAVAPHRRARVRPAYSSFRALVPDSLSRSICMGLGYFFIAFAMLTGTPINGALLGHGSDLHWPSPIVFSSVSLARPATTVGHADGG